MDSAAAEQKLRSFFEREPNGAVAVYMFGSVARGESRPSSDVDVAALFAQAPPRTLRGRPFRLEAALEALLERPVQLVTLNDAAPDLVHRVLRDGRLLLDRDPAWRIRFEVQARNAYFDLEPVRRAYRGPAFELQPMTDPELVAKKLALIETCVHELKTLARPQAIRGDVREERFVEHTLQIALQAALDVASHIVSDERLGEPETNRELFAILRRAGALSESQSQRLQEMAGFRNVVVHGYQGVDLDIVRDVVENHLGDLVDFVAAIRARLG